MREFRIAVFPGDGIGPEVMASCLALLEAASARAGGFRLAFEAHEAGAALYARTGVALPDTAQRAAETADAILLAAMGLPNVRYPDSTEVAPHLDFRERFELYAGVRPVFVIPGIPLPLSDPRARHIDLVIVRESTEGLFAARRLSQREGDEAVSDTMRISRRACQRLFAFAFDLARARRAEGKRGRVTCVDKANVLPSLAFFRELFLAEAARHPDIEADCLYVDAAGLRLVRAPWELDVLVTENMFGDILSDIGAALMGGMGMAPSADIGDERGLFQPCHGTAPDIVGRGLANPTAMFLSAAMMLDWLGRRHDVPACALAATSIRRAIDAAFAPGDLVPTEIGGSAGTEAISRRVLDALEAGAPVVEQPV